MAIYRGPSGFPGGFQIRRRDRKSCTRIGETKGMEFHAASRPPGRPSGRTILPSPPPHPSPPPPTPLHRTLLLPPPRHSSTFCRILPPTLTRRHAVRANLISLPHPSTPLTSPVRPCGETGKTPGQPPPPGEPQAADMPPHKPVPRPTLHHSGDVSERGDDCSDSILVCATCVVARAAPISFDESSIALRTTSNPCPAELGCRSGWRAR